MPKRLQGNRSVASLLCRSTFLLAGALLASSPAARAQPGTFYPHPDTPTFGSGFTNGVKSADLDFDGDQDALVVVPGFAAIWLNDGAGNMSPHPTAPTMDCNCEGAALGDVDGDGDYDIVFAIQGVNPEEQVWVNNGTGTFTPHPTTPEFGGDSSYDVGLADIDSDSDLDAVVANNNTSATVWLNDGDGNFTAHPTTPSLASSGNLSVALGNLDGDADVDLVLGTGSVSLERIFLNDGAGNFSAHPVTPTIDSGGVFGIALGDIDGDNDLDVVMPNFSGPATVWLNNGAGSLTPHPLGPTLAIEEANGVSFGDIDNDGDRDAVFSGGSGPNQAWLNNGAGVFTLHPAQAGFGNASYSTEVALADLDGDGGLDALVATGNGEIDEVYLNGEAPASILEVPTVSGLGAAVFAFLLAIVAALLVRRVGAVTNSG